MEAIVHHAVLLLLALSPAADHCPPQSVLAAPCPPQNVLAPAVDVAGLRWEPFSDGDRRQVKLMRAGVQIGTYRFSDRTYWPAVNGRLADVPVPPPIVPPVAPLLLMFAPAVQAYCPPGRG